MHRLRKREDEEDKKIPDDVIAKQVEVFEVPTNDEDFDMVVYEQ